MRVDGVVLMNQVPNHDDSLAMMKIEGFYS